ncbi:hypothetical protein Droror1_Dr00002472 [Drosera rotundifolia]
MIRHQNSKTRSLSQIMIRQREGVFLRKILFINNNSKQDEEGNAELEIGVLGYPIFDWGKRMRSKKYKLEREMERNETEIEKSEMLTSILDSMDGFRATVRERRR